MSDQPQQPQEYDLIVIGSGPAGQKAALAAAKHRCRVALIDQRRAVGGACLHTGTIPSKTLREAVLYFTGYGLHNVYGAAYRPKEHITRERDILLGSSGQGSDGAHLLLPCPPGVTYRLRIMRLATS